MKQESPHAYSAPNALKFNFEIHSHLSNPCRTFFCMEADRTCPFISHLQSNGYIEIVKANLPQKHIASFLILYLVPHCIIYLTRLPGLTNELRFFLSECPQMSPNVNQCTLAIGTPPHVIICIPHISELTRSILSFNSHLALSLVLLSSML